MRFDLNSLTDRKDLTETDKIIGQNHLFGPDASIV